MHRIAYAQLVRWKSAPRRKPLIVRGARQVGKTWLIERFAEAEFDRMVKVDLEQRRDLHRCFGDDLDAGTVIRHLELDGGSRIVPGSTLLFLDEVQACPRAIMALRYLYEQMPALHVVAAGSLLEFALGEIPIPVGRASADDLRFKAALLDIGLLQSLCRVPVEMELRERDLLAIYRGVLAAQFAAQELAAGCGRDLFYWARNARGASAEVDYLAVRDGRIVPVEVKSGASGSLRSLHLMLKAYPHCADGVVLYSGSHSRLPAQRLTFMPLYYAGSIGDPAPDVV